MAICAHCGGEMTEGISCLTDPVMIGGKAYSPIRWGQEPRPRHRYEPEECRDCGTPMGGVHHPGCAMERCPACHGQAIGCGCVPDSGVDGVHVQPPAGRAMPLARPAARRLALTSVVRPRRSS